MDKKLKDSIAVRLYNDKITDQAFEGLKQHNYFNRGFKKDFAQEMIIMFYELEDDKLDSIWEKDGYKGIKAFYFRMCIFQLLGRSNKMPVKWLGSRNMFVDIEHLNSLCEYGAKLDTKMLDIDDYNEQLYNDTELGDVENNVNDENTDIADDLL